MKSGMFISALIIAFYLATGVSNGQGDDKETRNLSDFTKVNFGVAGELYINIGSEYKVVLEGSKSLLEEIKTEVSDNKLVIKRNNWYNHMNEKVTVYITMPELTGLSVSGSGKAEIRDAVKADRLNLGVSGSGKLVTGDLTVDELNAAISGSGDIIMSGGDARKADISISGSGSYSGESLKIGRAEFSISGSGNCKCNVTDNLIASVSGSGNVTYIGSPKIDARVSGSGHVRSR
jgi:Putative auto-transporter adhesin, head GIN domain